MKLIKYFKNKIWQVTMILSLVAVCTSCATIFYGNKGNVTIDSVPPNCSVEKLEISRGMANKVEYNVTFPYKLPRRFAHRMRTTTVKAYATKDSQPKSVSINKNFNAAFLGNLLLGGIPGMTLDCLAGTCYYPSQNYYMLNFYGQYNNSNNNAIAQNATTNKVNSQTDTNIEKAKLDLEKAKLELEKDKFEFEKNKATNDNTSNKPSGNNNVHSGNSNNEEIVITSDVDENIPVSSKKSDNTFVLIIANEEYTFMDNVQFAKNDGRAFKQYCIKTLGVPERQVWLYENASLGIISGGVDKMLQAMSIFDNSKVIVYYCGHGIPDEKTGDAFIVPIDGKGTNTATCFSLQELYKTMSSSKAESVTYFFDACFTGTNKEGSMLVAARGTPRAPKKEVIEGNSIVFAAASGDETAMTYKEKQHGLFTYFLLKKLQETQGDVSYEELANYINNNVKKEAFLTNEKPQNPVTITSHEALETWKTMKLK